MNSYYGAKDQEYNSSFIEAKWLTPYEVLQILDLKPNSHLPSCSFGCSQQPLIYPNELIFSRSEPQYLIDAILIAKYSTPATSSNVVRLKSVLLSQILAAPHAPLLILSLPKDTYRWSKVSNINLMPPNALRVGFDSVARQFVYIGRLKLDHLLKSNQQPTYGQAANFQSLVFGCNNNNIFGSLINVYEYIPAILLQLNDISSLNQNLSEPAASVWSRLRQSASNRLPSFVVSSLSSNNNQTYNQQNQAPIDFNLTTTNYEVLCLNKQAATLKQLAAQQLIRLDEEDPRFAHAIRSLPNSIRTLILPTYLIPGQCVIKHAKMRSANYVYELGVSAFGVLRFVKRDDGERQVATVEKYVESLLVLKSGVYIVFDSNQTTRRPLILYQQRPNSYDSFYLELTNDGYLRVINSSRLTRDIFNLNEYFQPAPPPPALPSPEKQTLLNQRMIVKQDSLININLRVFLDDLRTLPVKIFNIVLTVLKSFVETVFYRRARVNRRAL